MSASIESLRTWTARQWWRVIGMILVVQVVLIFAFSQRSRPTPRAESSLTIVKLVPASGSSHTSVSLGGVPDPTLFALMNRQGFSARPWLDFSFFQHSLNDWQEPVRWLAPDVARFGQDFLRKVQTTEINRPLIEDKPAPRADVPEVGADISLQRSVVELSAELAGRALAAPLIVPSQAHGEILTNSIVQVVVNATGDVLSARLVRGSGSKIADQAAVELAGHTRFKPVRSPAGTPQSPASALSIGDLIFRWHTVPLVVTNRATGTPKK